MPKVQRLTAASTIADLAKSGLLEKLKPRELSIYVRLLVLRLERQSATIEPKNAELYKTPQEVAAALRTLRELKLVKTDFGDPERPHRTITVL